MLNVGACRIQPQKGLLLHSGAKTDSVQVSETDQCEHAFF